MVILTESYDEGVETIIVSKTATNFEEFVNDINEGNAIVKGGTKDAISYFKNMEDDDWADGLSLCPLTVKTLTEYMEYYSYVDGDSSPRIQVFVM